jgi:hypothetical protein
MLMPPGPAPPPDDDALLARLRHVAGRMEPVPLTAQIAARAAIEWRTLDAELAALVHDSALDAELLLAVRGVAAGPRALTFEVPDLTIEIEAEVTDESGRLSLAGQLVPPQAAEVTIRHGEQMIAVRADERGRFAARGVAPGPLSLRCRLDAAPGDSRLVETAWLTV